MPTPPDLAPIDRAYENPTAELAPSNVQELLSLHRAERERLERIDYLRPVHRAVQDFDESVTISGDGERKTVRVDGIPIRTTAIIDLEAPCGDSGEGTPDDMRARVVVVASDILPTLWGGLERCIVHPRSAPDAWLWGPVSVFVPTLGSESTPVYVIDYTIDRIQVLGLDAEPGWSGNLRYVGNSIEVLITDSKGDTAVLSGAPRTDVVHVRGRNGRFQCVLEARRCDSLESSEASFSY